MIRTRVIAVLGIAFAFYWLLISDPQPMKPLTLDPVKPSLVQVLNPPYAIDPDPNPPRSPASTKPEVSLRQWLKAEAAKVGRVDSNPEGTLQSLRQKARKLKSEDLELLKTWALNSNLNGDERFLSVYMIGLDGSKLALMQLREISLTEIPDTATERLRSEEILIRAQAIEALVQKLDSADAKRVLRQILGRTLDPVLARHVQFWLNKLT